MLFRSTVVGDVTQDHDLVVTKTRALFLKDAVIKEAGEELGKRLAAWLSDGAPAPVQSQAPAARRGWLDRVNAAMTVEELGHIGDDADEAESTGELSPTQRKRLDAQVTIRMEQLREVANGVA